MGSPVALLFTRIHHQILSDGAGVGRGCQNLLQSLLEVLSVKHNETSVMGGASVITLICFMHHPASLSLKHPAATQVSSLFLSPV